MMAAPATPPGRSLAALLEGAAALPPELDREITGLSQDSRSVQPGDLFFARRGLRASGADFIAAAVAGGARAVLREGRAAPARGPGGVPVLEVADLDACMGAVADRFFGRPSRRLRVIGVTGTNGKTSVSWLLAGALDRLAGGARCGLLGTLGHGFPGRVTAGAHTTPDSISTHRLLARMLADGAQAVAMEVSSHGLEQGRVAGVRFDTAVFTNLSRDHLDYHGDMESYAAAKRRLFRTPGLRAAVINADDVFGRRLLAAPEPGVEACAYGLESDAAGVRGRVLECDARGTRLELLTPAGRGELRTPLLGRFNARNLLATLAVLLAGGTPLEPALQRLASLGPPPGRMERFGGRAGMPLVVVDYAHTPDALENALLALRPLCRGRLWCVFGCGGERDTGKRPLMGAVAARHADVVVLTDDNPRREDGDAIIAGIRAGLPEAAAARVERDRAAAIRGAVCGASPTDVVLVAGKGHEPCQEAGGVRRAFSDAAWVRSALGERSA